MRMTKSKILRKLFKEKDIVSIVGAHDGLSAKLVEYCGFDAVWASGLEISTSYAVPDANILTMSQYLERASEANDAVSIPVVADCDTGYGNSNNVMHMVRRYEAAGIAAVCIEDKKFPKVNSLFLGGRQELAPIAEFVGKITAAKNTQVSNSFMVIARVEALIAGAGEKEALLRAEKYVEAGADAILIHSKSKKYDEIVSFAKKWDKRAPLVIVPTTYPSIMADLSKEELSGLGIKMLIYANHGLRASIKATVQVLKEIKSSGGIHNIDEKIAPLDEVFKLQGIIDMKQQEQKYLKSEHEDVAVVIPAAGQPVNQDSIEPLLRDRSLCMIDINGKSLLQRNIDILRVLGIKDINIVVGYKQERFHSEFGLSAVNLIVNSEFKTKHILHSVMLAGERMVDRTIVAYSDILFERQLVDNMLRLKEDIVLVGDSTYKKYGRRNKKLDLVKVSETLITGKREIITDELLTIERLGSDLDEACADFEFIGLAYFSRSGIRWFKDLYNKKKEELKNSDKTFHGAQNFGMASLVDMLQEAIDSGISVKLLPVTAGWMEIHEFEDYKFACKKIKG
ncbi:isocitrate lyase/phosphoenolpyruvate mutase family protein [Candidatus Omnitrophota bacterium]